MSLFYVNGKKMKSNEENKFDQYYTKKEISEHLFNITKEQISKLDQIDKYTWLEPSVGEGCFFDLLPQNKRIGIDIEPVRSGIIQSDYLKYNLPDKPLIVIGNPPFGHRGVLALEFIKHSKAAEYVAFILPMFFTSTGKGSIRYRVADFNLVYEEILPDNSFYLANNKDKDVKCCFQIWSKNRKVNNEEFSWYNNRLEPFGDIIEVKTVSLAKNRECGKEWIFNKKADYYLSSTFFKAVNAVQSFKEVNYKSGLAIIIKTANKKFIDNLRQIIENADWVKYSSLATNGCRHIGKSHIFKLLKDKGVDLW